MYLTTTTTTKDEYLCMWAKKYMNEYFSTCIAGLPHLHRREEQRDEGDQQRCLGVGFGHNVEELV